MINTIIEIIRIDKSEKETKIIYKVPGVSLNLEVLRICLSNLPRDVEGLRILIRKCEE